MTRNNVKRNGTAMLLTVFIIAFMSVLVVGMLENSTEEIQLMRNQINGAVAVSFAQAGLNDAFAELRNDADWSDGFTDKSYHAGTYSVAVEGDAPNLTITSTATTSGGFVAVMEADVTLSAASPYIIKVDAIRINE